VGGGAGAAVGGLSAPLVAGAACGGLLFLLLLLCCCWWLLCAAPRRRKRREAEAAAVAAKRAHRKSAHGGRGRGLLTQPSTKMSGLLGLPAAADGKQQAGTLAAAAKAAFRPEPSKGGVAAVFSSINPALLHRPKRGSTALRPTAPAGRGPRISLALAGYNRMPAAAAAAAVRKAQPVAAAEEVEEERVSVLEEEGKAGAAAASVDEYLLNEEDGDVRDEAEPDADAEDDDYEDEDEPADGEAGAEGGGGGSRRRGYLRNKLRAAVSMAATAPATEPRALVIGKGKLHLEQAVQQVVRLKRVSKVRGDQTLTAMRARQSVRRMSTAAAAAFGPSAAASGGGGGGYAFTATVGRKQLRVSTERTRRPSAMGAPITAIAVVDDQAAPGPPVVEQ